MAVGILEWLVLCQASNGGVRTRWSTRVSVTYNAYHVGSKQVVFHPLGGVVFWLIDDHALHKFRGVPPLLEHSQTAIRPSPQKAGSFRNHEKSRQPISFKRYISTASTNNFSHSGLVVAGCSHPTSCIRPGTPSRRKKLKFPRARRPTPALVTLCPFPLPDMAVEKRGTFSLRT